MAASQTAGWNRPYLGAMQFAFLTFYVKEVVSLSIGRACCPSETHGFLSVQWQWAQFSQGHDSQISLQTQRELHWDNLISVDRNTFCLTFALNYFILLINFLRCQILNFIFALRLHLKRSVFNMCKHYIYRAVFKWVRFCCDLFLFISQLFRVCSKVSNITRPRLFDVYPFYFVSHWKLFSEVFSNTFSNLVSMLCQLSSSSIWNLN